MASPDRPINRNIDAVALAVAGNYYYKGFYRPAIAGQPFSAASSLKSHAGAIRQKAAFKNLSETARFQYQPVFSGRYAAPSGRNRFFVYDSARIPYSGRAGSPWQRQGRIQPYAFFSNVNGSGCIHWGNTHRITLSGKIRAGL